MSVERRVLAILCAVIWIWCVLCGMGDVGGRGGGLNGVQTRWAGERKLWGIAPVMGGAACERVYMGSNGGGWAS